jgi:hypothetical protein
MLGWLFSSKIIPLPISFAIFIKKKELKVSHTSFFLERCIGGHKANNFWHTVKPFLSNKSTGGQQKIVLMENDKKRCM